jgi:hypothetical protein
MNTKNYVSVLEKEYGKNKTPNGYETRKSLLGPMKDFGTYMKFSCSKSYKWTLRDRYKNAKKHLQERLKYLKKYTPLDFKTYEEEYNPYGFDIYTKITKTSSPLTRFKNFWRELKSAFKAVIKAFQYTPLEVKHFRKNKNRICWFENNLNLWPSRKKLEEKGYKVETDGVITPPPSSL